MAAVLLAIPGEDYGNEEVCPIDHRRVAANIQGPGMKSEKPKLFDPNCSLKGFAKGNILTVSKADKSTEIIWTVAFEPSLIVPCSYVKYTIDFTKF